MGLFGPWKPCPHCGTNVRRPIFRRNFLCSACGRAGPWASPEHVEAWGRRQAEERTRADLARRDEEARLAERQRQLDDAASLTPIQVPGLVTQKREQAYLAMEANLAEWLKQRGSYQGGSGIRGLSFPVPGLRRVRAFYGGLSQRRYVAGPEGWTITDSGTAVVTSKRLVFRGARKAVEWRFSKLVGLDADRSNGCLVVQVTNRQKAHVLQLADFELFEACLETAIAAYQKA